MAPQANFLYLAFMVFFLPISITIFTYDFVDVPMVFKKNRIAVPLIKGKVSGFDGLSFSGDGRVWVRLEEGWNKTKCCCRITSVTNCLVRLFFMVY
jgi:hypothetical protein